MSDWLREIRRLRSAGTDCVRVTVMDVRGSAPREIGATMLVTADDLRGSIGGGQLEYECSRIAAGQLRGRTSANSMWRPRRMRFPLGAAMGQCCGGVVDVLFEYVPAGSGGLLLDALHCFGARTPAVLASSIGENGSFSRSLLTGSECRGETPSDAVLAEARRILECGGAAACLREGEARVLLEPLTDKPFALALFGAGHVGSAVVSVLAGLDCRVRWVDSRRDVFPGSTPGNVTCVEAADPAREVLAMPPGAFYLVMTHSHALDYHICEQVLARDDFAYCGLIGSRSKRRRFEKRLRGQGMHESRIARLTCPIGIAGIDGKKPAEIAVAVAAQVLRIRQSQSARSAVGAAGSNVHLLRR